jgi:hypothetical protein
MKKIGLLAAAAAMMVATPAASEGYVGARYQSGSVDSGVDVDVTGWQGEGAFGWNSGSWGGQVGGAIGNVEPDGGTDADYTRFDAHLNWSGGGGFRIGGVVASTSIDDADLDEWVYGLEGAIDNANSRFWGSATLGTIDAGGSDYDTWNADAGVDFFANPNFRIGGNIGIGSVDDADLDSFSAGINAEIQPWSAPVSIYGGWQLTNFDGGGTDIDANYFSIGARWNFGGGSVQDRSNAIPFRTNTQYAGRLFDVGPR